MNRWKAEHFDILGILVWIFFLAVLLRSLWADKPISFNIRALMFVICFAGLLIDGSLVYRAFLKKK